MTRPRKRPTPPASAKRNSRRHRRALPLAALALALLSAIALLIWLAFRSTDAPDPTLIARVLFAESANCTPHERLLVAGVMQNRIHNPPFGNAPSLAAVVAQPGAFSCINDSANANWRRSAHPEQMTAAQRAVWQQCVDCLAAPIPPALGPSGRPLVYYHDKSITKPARWDNAAWHAVREVATEHFIFYSIVPAAPPRR